MPCREADIAPIRRYLMKQGHDRAEADTMIMDVVEDVQHGDSDGALQLLADALRDPPAPDRIELIGSFVRSIPLWELKGHSHAELNGDPKQSKPRRGDLCPCGSGRRYGSCCGRFQ